MKSGTLAGKLRLQPQQRVLTLNAPSGYVESLGTLPEGIQITDVPNGTFDLVHLFVKDIAQLEELGPVAVRSVKYDGLLWISYPKRASNVETDISRDTGWDTISRAGFRPVMQISIDDTWSALRFRPTERVGKSR